MCGHYTLTTKDFIKHSGVEQWSHHLKINLPYKTTAKLSDRTLVILSAADDERWLEPTLNQVEAVKAPLQPFTGKTRVYPVLSAVNSPKNNAPDLIAAT